MLRRHDAARRVALSAELGAAHDRYASRVGRPLHPAAAEQSAAAQMGSRAELEPLVPDVRTLSNGDLERRWHQARSCMTASASDCAPCRCQVGAPGLSARDPHSREP